MAAKNFSMGNSLAVETERLEADLVCERLESSGERPNLAVIYLEIVYPNSGR